MNHGNRKLLLALTTVLCALAFFSGGCKKIDTTPWAATGYVRYISSETNALFFDPVEWLTLDDADRIKELNINPELDMPNGFYIYNEDDSATEYTYTEKTEFYVFQTVGENWELVKTDSAGFAKKLEEYLAPFDIETKGAEIVKISERYIP